MKKTIFALMTVFVSACGSGQVSGTPSGGGGPVLANNQNIRRLDPIELVTGGYTIYFRHATQGTFPEGTTQEQYYTWDRQGDCVQGTELIEKGIQESIAIGNKFRKVGIPVGNIIASRPCRTRQTMEYAFGRVTEVVDYLLYFYDHFTEEEKARNRQLVHELFSKPVPIGENTLICGHRFGGDNHWGLPLDRILRQERGDAAIYLPNAQGTDFSLVGLIEVGTWIEP